METQTDPVCRMNVVPEDAAGQSDYQGRTYYFCSDSCKRQFDENPAQYTGSAAGQTG